MKTNQEGFVYKKVGKTKFYFAGDIQGDKLWTQNKHEAVRMDAVNFRTFKTLFPNSKHEIE